MIPHNPVRLVILHTVELIATCTLGLEGAVSRELKTLGYGIVDSESGRVRFRGDLTDVPKLNLWMRTAERILIVLGRGEVATFDDLFDLTISLPWEGVVEKGGRFPVVKVRSVDSKLLSERAIQRVVKKAVAERLRKSFTERRRR